MSAQTEPTDDVEDMAADAHNALSALLDEALGSDDPKQVGRVLLRLDALVDRAKQCQTDTEDHLLLCLEGRGLDRIEVGPTAYGHRWSTPRKSWKHDDLLRDVVVKAREHATGELEAPEWTVARAISACISFAGGKLTGLRAIGLDPDDYCETGASVKKVERKRTEPTGEPV